MKCWVLYILQKLLKPEVFNITITIFSPLKDENRNGIEFWKVSDLVGRSNVLVMYKKEFLVRWSFYAFIAFKWGKNATKL